jgi:hypothetical protein
MYVLAVLERLISFGIAYYILSRFLLCHHIGSGVMLDIIKPKQPLIFLMSLVIPSHMEMFTSVVSLICCVVIFIFDLAAHQSLLIKKQMG